MVQPKVFIECDTA